MTKIKIGLLVNDLTIPYWLAKSILEIQAGDYAEISVVIKKKNNIEISKVSNYSIILNTLPLIIASKLDQRMFKTPNDVLSRVQISQIIPNCPIIEVDTIETKHTDTFTADAIEAVKRYNLDLLFRSGFKILKGDILTHASKLGVWSFHHGNNRFYRGMPAGFWEVYSKNPTTGFILQQLTNKLDGGRIIAKGEIPTINFSLHKTRQTLYWDAQGMLIVSLKKLHEQGYTTFISTIINSQVLNIYDRPLFTAPNFWQSLLFLIKMLWRWIEIKWNKYLKIGNQDWYLGWMYKKDDYSFRKIKKLIPPKNHFWADPFIVSFKDEELLFFEDFEYKKNKGKISFSKFNKNTKSFTPAKPALETNYHLSFPFTFVHHNNLYVIPETKSAGTISLYKWVNEKLEFTCDLLKDIKAVDSTLLFKDNTFWLFTSQQVSEHGTIFHHHIYYSERLEGPYLPHAMNPICSSSKHSRAAGGFLKMGNELYRTSQDCSETYGKKIHLFKIITLNRLEYFEQQLDTIEAKWEKHLDKIHTINQSNHLVVIDIYGKFKR